jgi:ketosteroid isomerase-like protein
MIKTEREQIEELMAAYGAAVDAKDYDGFTKCFTPDATVAYEGYSQHLSGHAGIVDFMRNALEPLDGTQHLFTNFVVELAGDTGRYSCGMLAQHWRKGAPGGETYLIGGKYNADVRRSEGKWRIARLSFRSLWENGNRSLVPQA